MFADIAVDLRSYAILDCIEDPLIGLMRNDQIQLINLHAARLAYSIEARQHTPHGFRKDLAPLHLNEPVVQQRHRKRAADVTLRRQLRSMQTGLRSLKLGFRRRLGQVRRS